MGFLLIWLLSILIADIIGSRKNRGALCFFLGLLLGPLGVLFALLIEGRAVCPFCREKIHMEAVVCPHCRKDLPAKVENESTAGEVGPSREERTARAQAEGVIEKAKRRA